MSIKLIDLLLSIDLQDIEAMDNNEINVTVQCYIQAVGNSFFELSSVLWTSAIAYTLYLSVMWQMRPEQIEARFPRFLIMCWGVPAILSGLPFIDHAYGVAGSWCWITDAQTKWRFIQFYGELRHRLTRVIGEARA